jgi:ABC-2 type transport system ATP-binding protein
MPGLNGASKTTNQMLLGMVRPTAGSARLVGARAEALWSRVGYLVKTPHAYPDLTVREKPEVIRRLRRLTVGCRHTVPDPGVNGVLRVVDQTALLARDDAP